MFLVTSPIVINVPLRGLLAVETMHAIVQWLSNLSNEYQNKYDVNVCKQETSLWNEMVDCGHPALEETIMSVRLWCVKHCSMSCYGCRPWEGRVIDKKPENRTGLEGCFQMCL